MKVPLVYTVQVSLSILHCRLAPQVEPRASNGVTHSSTQLGNPLGPFLLQALEAGWVGANWPQAPPPTAFCIVL